MKTAHYYITNLKNFSEDKEAIEILRKYLDDIEGIFTTIEEVFGKAWDDDQIKIELNNSTGGAIYDPTCNPHVVKMGMYNRNIQKKYPENLWGCLFHETHHAFFNPIIKNKKDKKIFNGGCEGEPFNYAFMATTYLKLKEKNRIDTRLYKNFLDDLEKELPNGAKDLFKEYVNMFSMNIENFSKFINYLKSDSALFINKDNFAVDINKVKKFLLINSLQH